MPYHLVRLSIGPDKGEYFYFGGYWINVTGEVSGAHEAMIAVIEGLTDA